MARRATLRASDADREQVAERLRHATAEGRLLAEELEERLEAVFSARTYGELDAITADLPGTAVRLREPGRTGIRTRPWAHPVPIIALVLLAPFIFSVLLAAAVVIATVFSAWALLLLVAWWAIGHGRYGYRCTNGRYKRSLNAYGQWPAGRPGGARPRSWI